MQSIFIPPAFVYHYISTIKRDYTNQKNGLIPLNTQLSKNHKRSDTLFILGSGSSINQITDKQWNTIEQHDSIGFNFWIVHDFVPDFYKFELDLSEKNKRTDYYYQILDKKWELYKNKIIIYNHFDSKKDVPVQILQKLADNKIYYPRYIYIPGREIKSFNMSMKFLKMFEKYILNRPCLFAKRSSITLLISLALMWDYKKIVLCGIDLNNSKYFYDDAYYKEKYPGLNSGQSGLVHMSFDSKKNPFTIDKIIMCINDIMIQNTGKQLLVLNKSSALYPSLSKYD